MIERDEHLMRQLEQGFQSIARRKPVPASLAEALGPAGLKRLLDLKAALEAQGLGSAPPEARLAALRRLVRTWAAQ